MIMDLLAGIERTGHDDRAGHACGGKRARRPAHRRIARRLAGRAAAGGVARVEAATMRAPASPASATSAVSCDLQANAGLHEIFATMSDPSLPILIADDQRDVLEALRLLLKSEEHACRAFSDPGAALTAVKTVQFSVALIDLNYTRDTTSGAEGLDLLKALKRADPDLPVVVMTAWGSIDLAVEAMRLGAGDFIEKPWDNTRLISVLRNQIALGAALRREQRLRAENRLLREDDEHEFIAGSRAMQAVLTLIDRVAPTDANVLDARRERHRQGRRRAADPSPLAARRARAGQGQHGRRSPTACSKPRCSATCAARSPTRRPIASAASSGRRRHAVPRRDREHPDRAAGQAAARARGRRARARRLVAHAEGRRAPDRGDQRRPRRRDRAPAASARICCSGSTRSRCACRRCASGARTSCRWRSCFLPAVRSAISAPALHLSASALRALEDYPWPGNVRELSHVMERAVLTRDRSADRALGFQPAAGSADAARRRGRRSTRPSRT